MPPRFEPGQLLADEELQLKSRLIEAGWGAVWRADHPRHGAVFAVFWDDPADTAKASKRLERWRSMAQHITHLAPVAGFSPGAPRPHLLLPDSGAPLLSERLAQGPLTGREAARLGATLGHALVALEGEAILPLGLSPERIQLGPGGKPEGLAILPFGLFDPSERSRHDAAAWQAPNLLPEDDWDKRHADVFALGLLVVAAATGKPGPPSPGDRRGGVPYSKLSTLLSNLLVSQGGAYPEPKVAVMMLERWLAREAVGDEKELAERKADAQRTPAQRALHRHKPLLVKLGAALGAVLAVVLVGMLLIKSISGGDPADTPRGVARAFFEALVDRDPAAADRFAREEAAGRAAMLLAEVERLEAAALASRLGAAQAPRLGDASISPIQGTTSLVGENGDAFMRVDFVLKLDRGTRKWHVATLLWAPLVGQPEEPRQAP
ncbi:MAG: hypothetical protein SF028_13810 [Candidatus Sumerlaeia bacterium]|nr:hypothetical protein [Candidatus Sumerlaeia bacterium]